MKHAFIRLATLSAPHPQPFSPEYRREKGARSIKVLFGNSNPSTIFLLLNTAWSGQLLRAGCGLMRADEWLVEGRLRAG